jgi:hypothetical protein
MRLILQLATGIALLLVVGAVALSVIALLDGWDRHANDLWFRALAATGSWVLLGLTWWLFLKVSRGSNGKAPTP